MHKVTRRLVLSVIPALALSACFDGTNHFGPEEARLRVRKCVYSETASGTYVGLATRWGWETWRDVFRRRDMLIDNAVLLMCTPQKTDPGRPARSKCVGYSFAASSSHARRGAPVEGVLQGDLGLSRTRISLELRFLPSPDEPQYPEMYMEIHSVPARLDREALVDLFKGIDTKGELTVTSWMKELRR